MTMGLGIDSYIFYMFLAMLGVCHTQFLFHSVCIFVHVAEALTEAQMATKGMRAGTGRWKEPRTQLPVEKGLRVRVYVPFTEPSQTVVLNLEQVFLEGSLFPGDLDCCAVLSRIRVPRTGFRVHGRSATVQTRRGLPGRWCRHCTSTWAKCHDMGNDGHTQ